MMMTKTFVPSYPQIPDPLITSHPRLVMWDMEVRVQHDDGK